MTNLACTVSARKQALVCRRNSMSRDSSSIILTGVVVVLFTLAGGCLSHPRVETVVHESSRGTVSLKEFPDSNIRASHPVTLDPDLMRRVLTGVRARQRKTTIESTLTGNAKSIPVFTFSEASFLAPLLVSALGQATAEEEVRFTITNSMSGKRLDTKGAVYATGETLNLSLTDFGFTPQRPGTLSQPSRSFDRAKRWSLTFSPEAAVVNWQTQTQISSDGSLPNTLVLSLEDLTRHPHSITRVDPAPKKGKGQGTVNDVPTPAHEKMEEELRRLEGTVKEQEERLEQLERQMDDM